MLKKLKENKKKQQKQFIESMYKQNQSIDKERNYKKEPKRNAEIESITTMEKNKIKSLD